MTLDELIDQLVELRSACPAAGCATVIGFFLDEPVYEKGAVWFGDIDPKNCSLVEVETPAPPPTRGAVH